MFSATPARRAASSPPTSCSSASSPVSSHVGRPVASAAPSADETTPSMPLAPRLARKRSSLSDCGKKASTSRIGIEELTQTDRLVRQLGLQLGENLGLEERRRAGQRRWHDGVGVSPALDPVV